MKNTIKVFGAAVVACAFGCGIKGDPLPPAEQQTVQAAQEIVPAAKAPTAAEPAKKIKKKNDN